MGFRIFFVGSDDGVETVGEVEAKKFFSNENKTFCTGNVPEATAKNILKQNDEFRRRGKTDILKRKLLRLSDILVEAEFQAVFSIFRGFDRLRRRF